MEKLIKALEALKVMQPPPNQEEMNFQTIARKKDIATSKKEKLAHASTIADSICLKSFRSNPDFLKYLGIALETFLWCCDDEDSDVRLMADECLNRTIKTLLESHLSRLQVELFKEIKKDGPARSLRAALSRFADLAHLIRPQKYRPYCSNLMPCLIKVCKRPQESVQETLAISLSKIMPVLGHVASESELKGLIEAYLPNLTNNSAVMRRTAATSLVVICQYSRKPPALFKWLLCTLLNYLSPVQPDHSTPVILGVLLCFRHLAPHLASKDAIDIPEQHILQVYELEVHYTQHVDHNVATAALEALQSLLRTPPRTLLQKLLSPLGITQSLIHSPNKTSTSLPSQHAANIARFKSQSSLAPSSAPFMEDDIALVDEIETSSEANPLGSQTSLPQSEDSGGGVLNQSFVTGSLYDDQLQPLSSALSSEEGYSNIEIGRCLPEDVDNTPTATVSLSSVDAEDLNHSAPTHTVGVNSLPTIAGLKKGASDERLLGQDEDSEGFWEQTSTPSPGILPSARINIGPIGSFTDPDVPLQYLARLLSATFLLTGNPGEEGLMPDKNVRVSVKSLAVHCLTALVSLYPRAFFLTLHKGTEEGQKISDTLYFTNHPDPHLKGSAALLLGQLVHSVLSSQQEWALPLEPGNIRLESPSLDAILLGIEQVISDEASVATKHGLAAARLCLPTLLHSQDATHSVPLIEASLTVRGDRYWLVRVELAKLLGEVPYLLLHHVDKFLHSPIQAPSLQDRALDAILTFLSDDDYRVRQAASKALVSMVPKLFFPPDHPFQDEIIALGRILTKDCLGLSAEGSLHSANKDCRNLREIEGCLSRVVTLLSHNLLTAISKDLILGCCEALHNLIEDYGPAASPLTWKLLTSLETSVARPYARNPLIKQPSSGSFGGIGPTQQEPQKESFSLPFGSSDLLNHLLTLLTSSPLILELQFHQQALPIVGHILTVICLQPPTKSPQSQGLVEGAELGAPTEWAAVHQRHLIPLLERLLQHIFRVLNIFSHVLEEQIPLQTHSRVTVLPSIPNAPSLSPIKRKGRFGSKDETSSGSNTASSNLTDKSNTTGGGADAQDDSKKNPNKLPLGGLGQFHTIPLYIKLWEILKASHASYKISMDVQPSEKFGGLLRATLNTLAQVLKMAGFLEMVKVSAELLAYLKVVMTMEPSPAIDCIKQLLQALFGGGSAALLYPQPVGGQSNMPDKDSDKTILPGYATRCKLNPAHGLYVTCLANPSDAFASQLKATSSVPEEAYSLIQGVKVCRFSSHGKVSKGDKISLASHIRLFEGVVIKALKLYTVTNDMNLQSHVLELLAELVHLRVNYCLLDADQVFISFVVKQVESLEDAAGQHLPPKHLSILIPRIFDFLVLLSYEKYHSKPIIDVPKVLQLCDGLLATGQPPEYYAIPALQPVVEDLFLVRQPGKVDSCRELETQREVIISMLLRRVAYHQVLEMFILILGQYHKEGEDKWKKLSRQVVDSLLPLLIKQQIRLDGQKELDILHCLFSSVSPSVFRPDDLLLKALFTSCQTLDGMTSNNTSGKENINGPMRLCRWLGGVVAILRVLLLQTKEEVLLSRLAYLDLYLIPSSPLFTFNSENPRIENPSQHLEDPSPEYRLIKFLFQVVQVAAEALKMSTVEVAYKQDGFLPSLLSHLLLFLTHMFQAGSWRQIALQAMALAHAQLCPEKEGEEGNLTSNDTLSTSTKNPSLLNSINETFRHLARVYPTLTLQWANILTLLNVPNLQFWQPLLLRPQLDGKEPFIPCHMELVRRGGIILQCDYVCENLNEVEQLTWLLVNHIKDLILLCQEGPVADFISAIHRNPAASGLLIQAIYARCDDFSKASFVKKCLHCLEGAHLAQSSSLLFLLVERFLPGQRHLVTARLAEALACRRLEYLLSLGGDPSPLSVEDVTRLQKSLKPSQNERLFSLLDKLLIHLQGPEKSPSQNGRTSSFTPPEINKEWYLSFVKDTCLGTPSIPSHKCALLLRPLSYEDILEILQHEKFHLPILEHCLTLNKGKTTSSPEEIDKVYRSAMAALKYHVNQVVSSSSEEEVEEEDTAKISRLISLIPALVAYLSNTEVPLDLMQPLAHFTILCTQISSKMSDEDVHWVLSLFSAVLHDPGLSVVLGLNVSWTCTAVASLHHLVLRYHSKDCSLPSIPFPSHLVKNTSETHLAAQQACSRMAQLISWLELDPSPNIPQFISSPLRSCIIGCGRLSLVNGFARTPPLLWTLGWQPSELGGDFETLPPPPPGEFLQERDVLKHYIFRLNLLGWISRQQFEETWMSLLGVLSATPLMDPASNGGDEDDQERVRASCLAVKSITSLLLGTLLQPQPGNPQNSRYLHHPRDRPLPFLDSEWGKKLQDLRRPIQRKLYQLLQLENSDQHLNIERVTRPKDYTFGQVSLEYLWAAVGSEENSEEPSPEGAPPSSGGAWSHRLREERLTAAGLDIHSCLHFLLDLYSQWLAPLACCQTPLALLTEVARSVVVLSDLWMERSQHEWMLDTLLELQRIHPVEDEILSQYLILAVCKAAAVLGMEPDLLEQLRKLVEISLKSVYLGTRLASLHGLLYLLEHGEGAEGFPLLAVATDYLDRHLVADTAISGAPITPAQSSSLQIEEHVLGMWALAFYILENYLPEDHAFSQKILQASMQTCAASEERVPISVYLCILKGLERLLLAQRLSSSSADALLKLTTNRLSHGNPPRALAALDVMFAAMYLRKGNDNWSVEESNPLHVDYMIAGLEKVSALFDRIKSGFPFEAELLCEVLPIFLLDFFPLQDVLNKVIGEFLSRPYPQLLADVVFKVFGHLQANSQQALAKDWVLLSLSNFAQKSPLSAAVWSLTVFFVAASVTPWLRSLFPFLQSRFGKLEECDRHLFLLAGLDFNSQLHDKESQVLVSTLKTVALPETPYQQLLQLL